MGFQPYYTCDSYYRQAIFKAFKFTFKIFQFYHKFHQFHLHGSNALLYTALLHLFSFYSVASHSSNAPFFTVIPVIKCYLPNPFNSYSNASITIDPMHIPVYVSFISPQHLDNSLFSSAFHNYLGFLVCNS